HDALPICSPIDTVLLVSRLIPDRFEYRRGATFVDSSIADLLFAGAGVCQDFVHLGLCLLRHHGIAARYVSGYLFAAGRSNGSPHGSSDGSGASSGPPGTNADESVEVDTHAWLEALLPMLDGSEP